MPDSIHALPLGDPSGRHARGGFEYQDHIGAGYCLHMLTDAAPREIWFESHDDITLHLKELVYQLFDEEVCAQQLNATIQQP